MLLIDSSLMGFLLPFLLILAVVYGALRMGSPFKNKAVNFVIAVVLAMFGASYEPAVEIISSMLPYAAVIFIIVFLIGFIKSAFRQAKGKETDFTLLAIVAGLAALFLASPIGSDMFGTLSGLGNISADSLAAAAGIFFVLIMLVVAYKKWKKD